MTLSFTSLLSIHVGSAKPLGGRCDIVSGFVKERLDGPALVSETGILGDEQADLRVHGGPEKAVYAYPSEHYTAWRERHPAHADLLIPGSLGENLAIMGMDEASTCIGDILRIGEAGPLLQVTQPRQPCFKLGLRFRGDGSLSRTMTREGWSGWYLRVLEPGQLVAGARIDLVQRPNPQWPVRRFARMLATQSGTEAEMQELANMQGLATQWREMAQSHVSGAI